MRKIVKEIKECIEAHDLTARIYGQNSKCIVTINALQVANVLAKNFKIKKEVKENA